MMKHKRQMSFLLVMLMLILTVSCQQNEKAGMYQDETDYTIPSSTSGESAPEMDTPEEELDVSEGELSDEKMAAEIDPEDNDQSVENEDVASGTLEPESLEETEGE